MRWVLLFLLACAVPVDPQWRALRVAETMLARDLDTPLSELRYPGQSRPTRRAQAQSLSQSQQPARSRRQYRGKQSTFSLLRQLIGETAQDTRSAFNQIADILGSQFADIAATRPTTTTTPRPGNDANSSSSSVSTTTTPAPYRISRQELLGILRRNSVGLGRLFRKEYDQAMQDSKVNLNRFKQEFRLAVAPFLQPATTEAPSSTTNSS